MARRYLALLVAFTLGAAACSSPAAQTTTTRAATLASTSTTEPVAIEDVEAAFTELPFNEFLDASYEQLLRRSPETVTALGIGDQLGMGNGQLDNLSDAYLRQTRDLETKILETLETYDRHDLAPDEQISYDVYEWYLDRQVRGHEFAYHDYKVNYFITSYNSNLLELMTEVHPLETLEDVEDYLLRLEGIGGQIDQVLEGLEIRKGMGIAPTAFVVDWSIGALREDLAGIASSPAAPNPKALAIYTTFLDRIEHLELDERASRDVAQRAEDAIRGGFIPGWQSLIAHLESIKSQAREEVGVWGLPDGDRYYEFLLRHHTTTELTPDEIHELGLEQVARVQDEMAAAFDALGFSEDKDLGALRSQARGSGGYLDGDTPEAEAELLKMYEQMIDSATSAGEAYFSGGPEAPMIIVPEPVGQGGYYVAGTADGSRPGAYHAGIQGEGLSRYTLATVLYHEAVPGHHFQISFAQELDLPNIRRFETFTAYLEGWALYAERLAFEMGLYSDDAFGDVGRLELELLRAVRLVVDTGIHHRHWTREQARTYMIEAMGDRSWTHEVERYVSYPGQATSYMIGQQTILDLRADAAAALGDEFDIIAFHDIVLGSGSLPLAVLETVVAGYISGD